MTGCARWLPRPACATSVGLAAAAEAVGAGATALPDIDSLADRIAIVRGVDPLARRSRSLHDVFFRRYKGIEAEGTGGFTPDDCD